MSAEKAIAALTATILVCVAAVIGIDFATGHISYSTFVNMLVCSASSIYLLIIAIIKRMDK